MRSLDNVLAPYLDKISVRYFTEHFHLPPTINHAIRHFSNAHCNHHVRQFCDENDISLNDLFASVGLPVTCAAIENVEQIKASLELRGETLIIDDSYVHQDMNCLVESLSITHQLAPRTDTYVDELNIVDCIEYLSLLDKKPITRMDGLSLTNDIGFMTALTLRQYIETGDRYYLVQALPNIIERERTKLSTVLRLVEDNEFSRLPIHISTLILSVEESDDICVKTTLEDVVVRTWPLTSTRFNLILDKIPPCPSYKKAKTIASNLAYNPTHNTKDLL